MNHIQCVEHSFEVPPHLWKTIGALCEHNRSLNHALIHPYQSQTEEGVFGSKFVTVCITGNKDCEVEMVAYQVRWF